MPKRIVLDTNIWVSYFINARADYLIKWIIDHPIIVYTSQFLIDEIEEVLQRPKFKHQFPFSVKDFIRLHNNVCEVVHVPRHYHIAPDPDDDFLFDLCYKVSANYLITSDKKLLNFSPPFKLKTITFAELRTLF